MAQVIESLAGKCKALNSTNERKRRDEETSGGEEKRRGEERRGEKKEKKSRMHSIPSLKSFSWE
jgi:hypothetical protein